MNAMVQAPLELVEEIAALQLPFSTDNYLQELMDRNTNGELTPDEKKKLEALADLSETISLFRAKALLVFGRRPAFATTLIIEKQNGIEAS
jgi:hypothetical protein